MAKNTIRFTIGLCALSVSGIVAAPAKADPPSWTPAHGAPAKQGDVGHLNKDHNFGSGDYGDLFLPNGNDLQCNRDVVGAILGGTTDAATGFPLGKGDGKRLATIGEAIFGMLAGNAIGSSMDATDSACGGYALDRLPDGQTAIWTNPDSQQQYGITPVKTFKNKDDQYCREYNASIKINDAQQQTYGTACLQPDGSWRVLS